MKTKKSPHSILLSLIMICCFSINLIALPHPSNEIKISDYENLSKKEIEQQLGRKLKLKEKIAIRLLKKRIKKANKETEKRSVKLELNDGSTISGFITKIQNDSIYLSNYVKKWPPQISSKYDKGEEIVISVSQVDKIRLKQTSKNGKTKHNKKTGIILLILSLLAMLLGRVVAGDVSKKTRDFDGIPGSVWLGWLIQVLGLVGLIIGFIILASSSAYAGTSTLKLNGEITYEQLEILKEYSIKLKQ